MVEKKLASAGNVGIGTATTPTERLQIVGNLKLSGSILTGGPETQGRTTCSSQTTR
jgi:hypothetical protein